jgi:phospholipid/cholesterol/gamma-HCH transport system substrate-binding protein
MRQQRVVETYVGLFMLLAIASLVFLAIKVSGLTDSSYASSYTVTAPFDTIGSLKIRAPVKIAGVAVGRVTNISLDKETYRATVTMELSSDVQVSTDSNASIYTEGLLGSNYINLSPGYGETMLKNGDVITQTTSALVLERLIGQYLFNMQK